MGRTPPAMLPCLDRLRLGDATGVTLDLVERAGGTAGDDVDTARSAEDIGVGSASTHRRAPFCFFALTLCAR